MLQKHCWDLAWLNCGWSPTNSNTEGCRALPGQCRKTQIRGGSRVKQALERWPWHPAVGSWLRIDFLSSQTPIDGAQAGPLVLNHVTTTRNVITVPSEKKKKKHNNKYTRSVNEAGVFTEGLRGVVAARQPASSSQGPRDQQGNQEP